MLTLSVLSLPYIGYTCTTPLNINLLFCYYAVILLLTSTHQLLPCWHLLPSVTNSSTSLLPLLYWCRAFIAARYTLLGLLSSFPCITLAIWTHSLCCWIANGPNETQGPILNNQLADEGHDSQPVHNSTTQEDHANNDKPLNGQKKKKISHSLLCCIIWSSSVTFFFFLGFVVLEFWLVR